MICPEDGRTDSKDVVDPCHQPDENQNQNHQHQLSTGYFLHSSSSGLDATAASPASLSTPLSHRPVESRQSPSIAISSTSPMMSDLLLALQINQNEQETNGMLSGKNSSSSSTNLRRWMHPPYEINQYTDEEEDEDNAYLSSMNDTTSNNLGNNSGLRASLDAGMTKMGRWMLSKATMRATSDPNKDREEAQLLSNNGSVMEASPQSDYRAYRQSSQHEHTTDNELSVAQRIRQRSVSEPEMSDFVRNMSSNILRQRKRNRNSQQPRQRSNTTNGNTGIGRQTTATLIGSSNASIPTSSDSTPFPLNTSHDEGFFTALDVSLGTNDCEIREATEATSIRVGTDSVASFTEQTQQQPQRQRTYNFDLSELRERPSMDDTVDPERNARIRWIRINQRFQTVMTWVELFFSFLLFAILICWVALTSTYVLSVKKPCDVPLKAYFWLVTFQLILDVFRSEIMRFVFHWDARSNLRIAPRVILYNVAYLIYALMVLRLGVKSVYVYDETPACRSTAPDLFKASIAFVSFSFVAWSTIFFGYLVPFILVAILLTLNGYSPSRALNANQEASDTAGPLPLFPAAYSTSGAPPGCVSLLREVSLESLLPSQLLSISSEIQPECCICMEVFIRQDSIVETKCRHYFHKSCCREWLRQARTCPVCRDDIPSTLGNVENNTSHNNEIEASEISNSIPIGPSGRPVVGLLRVLQRAASSMADNNSHLPTIEEHQHQRNTVAATNLNDTAAIASIEMESGNAIVVTSRY